MAQRNYRLIQWRNYNFLAPPANIRYGPRPNLILRYGDTGLKLRRLGDSRSAGVHVGLL